MQQSFALLFIIGGVCQFEQFDWYTPQDMIKMNMMIKTRPRYPSNKLTFTIADITKGTNIRFLDIILNLNAKFDVDLLLEDSKRICIFNIR